MNAVTTKRPARVKPKAVHVLPTADFVQPLVFEAITGYTVKAQERKREEGVWRENEVWTKAPDGRILMSISGYNAWVTSESKLF